MKNQFIQRFKETMTHACGVADGSAVIAGLSGGADSVALVSVLHATGYPTLALHVNFHLRGEESDRDERCATEVASRLGIRFKSISVDVAAFRAANPGLSVEMACRELRYRWFREIQQDEAIPLLAIAHHSDDNAETMLLNLMRGSGITGLRGMLPRSNGIIRPLLPFSREEILGYVTATGLPYIIDSSNLTNDYRRNQLRNDVLPRLRNYFPDAFHAISHTIANLTSTESLLNELTEKSKASYISPDGVIDLRKLANETTNAATLLYWWLKPLGFNHAQCRDMLAAISRDTASGQQFKATDCYAIIDHGMLAICTDKPHHNESTEIDPIRLNNFPSGLSAELTKPEQVSFSRDNSTMYLDYDKLISSNQKLVIRQPQTGDRLQPFGMKGSRLVSDIISDAKLDIATRKRIRVLTLGDDILWIVGLRASRHLAVTPSTRNILRITTIFRPTQRNPD